jgi:hypothetical protein
MWINHNKRKCVEIENCVFKQLLSFYPEEELLKRSTFLDATKQGYISYSDLISESETLFIPWQMFFLDKDKLSIQLKNIETNRADRLNNSSLMSKRTGKSGAYPKRLIDRFVRSQNFLCSPNNMLSDNKFNKSLIGLNINDSVAHILKYFSIDVDVFRDKKKVSQSIDYLIERISACNINIARGTTAHGLMPCTENHRVLYKNLSGFCLRDDKIPFIYLSTNEITGEEVVGRQIYTLIYLLALIGLDIYSLAFNDKNIVSIPGKNSAANLTNLITSELLLPKKELEKYRGTKISPEDVKEISLHYKATPRAVLFRLKKDHFITPEEHEQLINVNNVPLKTDRPRSPKIETSVKKLCGDIVFNTTNKLLKNGGVSPIQAQFILFGKPDKKKWKDYRSYINI